MEPLKENSNYGNDGTGSVIASSDDPIIYATFNQDSSCLAIGTERGFRIYNTCPFKDNFERNLEGGIGIIEMLNRSNIIALVGGGKNPKYTSNRVILWDDSQTKMISEMRFGSAVKNVKLKKDRLFVVCDQKIYVFNFVSFQNIDTIETYDNPKGIIAVSADPKVTVLAYPDKTKGYVRVKSYDKSITALINAHENAISCLALNRDGTLMATSSEKGTLIRIFRAEDGAYLQELRRGKEKAEIFSISFDPTNYFLASSSDRGTVHIWSLTTAYKKLSELGVNVAENNIPSEEIPKNQTSVLSKLFGGYFNSEWSFAQLRIDESKSICSFGPNNTIIVVSLSGKFYQATFDIKRKGECTNIQENSLNMGENN